MSRGRHSRPRARGGGLSAFLAIAIAGGAVVLAGTQPSGRVLRACVVGLAFVGSFQLLAQARTQRMATRGLARTEERLRTLEQRSRDEGDELHRRVLAGVAREGELRRAVEVLVDEIGRLRVSLESLVPAALAASPPLAAPLAEPAVPATPGVVADGSLGVDIPLIQRVLAAQEEASAPVQPAAAAPAAVPLAPAAAASIPVLVPVAAPVPVAVPAAGELWRAPTRPEYVPAHASVNAPVEVPVTSWVVRELQLEQPGAAVAMRILDLTTPAADDAAAEDNEPTSTWSAFARPA